MQLYKKFMHKLRLMNQTTPPHESAEFVDYDALLVHQVGICRKPSPTDGQEVPLEVTDGTFLALMSPCLAVLNVCYCKALRKSTSFSGW